MIKIFNENDKDFSTNGIINIKPISCKETKKKSLNGWYLDLQIDIRYQEYIKKDMLVVIKSKSKLTPQAFRLEEPKYNNGIIEIIANHVMFDSKRYMLYDVRPTNKSALLALEYINERTDKASPFTYNSSIEGLNTAYFELKNLCEAWEVMEERWGGVFDADNWDITFSANLGKYVGEMLVYKKNISSFIKYEDWSNVVTRIYPVGDEGLKLPEKYLESDIQYKIPYTKKVEFKKTLDTEDKTYSTEELIENLREQATKYLNENKYPQVSYEVTSNINESYDVNDKILVKHPLADIQTEVQEYTYDHNKKKTENLVFGNYTRDVKSRFDSIKNSILEVVEKANKNDLMIKHQTELINMLNKTGLLYINENEMLILDKLPLEEAKYVWRIGMGGIGFSKTGYEGPFETAWTQDGNFNASFIRSGKISTELIEGYEELLLKVDNFDNQSNNIAQIMIKQEQILQEISAISDTTVSDKNTNKIRLDDVNESNLIYLNIYPTATDISYLYPSSDLYPSELLYPLSRKLVFKNLKDNSISYYELPCDLLYYNQDNYDEFVYDYNTETCYKIKRIGLNSSGNKYVLSEPTNEYFTFPEILLNEGNYEIYLLSFSDAMIQARAMVKNLYSAQYVTQTQFNARINQTKSDINASVSEKITLANNKIEELSGELDIQAASVSLKLNSSDFTSSAIIGLINNRDGTSTAKINATNINLTGYVTISSLSGNETTTIDGSNIQTGTIKAERLDSKVITTDNFSAQNISADKIVSGTLTAASINLGNGTFKVSTAGALTATNATITGTIKAGNGSTIGGLTMSNGVLSSSRLSLNANAGIVSVFNESGGSMILSNAARLSATAGIGISSNSSGNISAPSKNIDLKACNGASVYLACMRGNAASAISSFTVANGAGYWSGGTLYVNNTPVGSSSSKNMKKNIKILNQNIKDELYDIVRKMNVYSYDFKKKYVRGLKNNVGFIIEDIEDTLLAKVLHIKSDKNDRNIKYYSDNDLTRVNLILIKELMKKVDDLEREVKIWKNHQILE